MPRSSLRRFILGLAVPAVAPVAWVGCSCQDPRDVIVVTNADAGTALTAQDVVDPKTGLPLATCERVCGRAVMGCAPVPDAGGALVECSFAGGCAVFPAAGGRRPAGMRAPRLEADGSSEARFLSHMAWLEAGAVHGFRQLAVELAGHHAPARFVRAARRAARDEVRHARTARALARRYGGVVPPVDVPPPVERPLVELAIENAVEGCVSETFGAIVAALQAATAEDAVVRAALARIVIDETRHAELAFELRDWLDGRLDRGARARVQDAYHRAVATLRSGVLHGANEQASRRLGVPGQARMQSILDEAATTLWA